MSNNSPTLSSMNHSSSQQQQHHQSEANNNNNHHHHHHDNHHHIDNKHSSTPPLYTPKNILLTGGAGFIGSNVLIYLCTKYPSYHLIVIDSLNPCASIHNLDEVKEHHNITFIHGDICNSILCIRLLREYH